MPLHTQPANNNAKRQSGFTLTELLVVLAVMAVLGMILFAVFARVREAGRASTCRNNLKQLVLAVQMYTQDVDGHFPDGGWKSQISPYLKTPSDLRCPTDVALLPRDMALDISKLPLIERLAVGYWYNAVDLSPFAYTGVGLSIEAHSRHESAIPATSTTWVMRDDLYSGEGSGGGGTLAYSHCNDSTRGAGSTLHSGGSNVSFLDGHVKWMTPETFYSTTCPTP